MLRNRPLDSEDKVRSHEVSELGFLTAESDREWVVDAGLAKVVQGFLDASVFPFSPSARQPWGVFLSLHTFSMV